MYVHLLYEVAATGTGVCRHSVYSSDCTVQRHYWFCHPLCSNEEQCLVYCKKKKKKVGMQACKHAHVRGTQVWFVLAIREKDGTSFFSLGSPSRDPTMKAAQDHSKTRPRCTRTFKGPLLRHNTCIFTQVHLKNCNSLGGEGSRYLGCVVGSSGLSGLSGFLHLH